MEHQSVYLSDKENAVTISKGGRSYQQLTRTLVYELLPRNTYQLMILSHMTLLLQML